MVENIAIVRYARTRISVQERTILSALQWGHITRAQAEQKLGPERARLLLPRNHQMYGAT